MGSDASSTTPPPYARGAPGGVGTSGRPSLALAANAGAPRFLQHMPQDARARRRTALAHLGGRSPVSAVELRNRNVTTDELFGLAMCFGVTIGEALDPTGPAHRRNLSFDLGLQPARLIEPYVARLWGASRVVVRLSHDDSRQYALDVADNRALPMSLDVVGLSPPAGQGGELSD